jgi:hypothetical protein
MGFRSYDLRIALYKASFLAIKQPDKYGLFYCDSIFPLPIIC